MQAGNAVPDETQAQLMVLAISDVAQAISAQPPAPAPAAGGAKAAAKPAGKAKKDEPKQLQVCCGAVCCALCCAVLCCAVLCCAVLLPAYCMQAWHFEHCLNVGNKQLVIPPATLCVPIWCWHIMRLNFLSYKNCHRSSFDVF